MTSENVFPSSIPITCTRARSEGERWLGTLSDLANRQAQLYPTALGLNQPATDFNSQIKGGNLVALLYLQ